METKPKNPIAFPTDTVQEGYSGMRLRDYFAAKAMQGLMSMENKGTYNSMEDCYSRIVELSYGVADAMLKQREK